MAARSSIEPSTALDEPDLTVRHLGRVSYECAQNLQERLVAARHRDRDLSDHLLLMELDPVVTIGTGGGSEQLLVEPSEPRWQGIDLVHTNRGGGATYHGPGQIVVYPIIDLSDRRDLHTYLRRLEQVAIDTLADFNLAAHRAIGLTGVWVGDRKIAAIGIRAQGWVTSHGLALNVEPNLDNYQLINQCGLIDKGVTSIGYEIGAIPAWRTVADILVEHFRRVFGYAGNY